MTLQAQTISVRFANALLENVVDEPAFDSDWIAQTGLSPHLLSLEGTRITMEKFAQLYRLIAIKMDDETVGMFSRPLRNGTLKYLCMIMLDAPKLSIALNRFRNFFRLMNDDIQFEITHTTDGLTRIALHENVDLGASRILALELMLMLMQGVTSWLIARKIPFVRIGFTFSEPAHAGEYEQLYPGPVHFNEPITALYMDPAYLDEPIRQDQSSLGVFIRNAPMDWFYFSDTDRPHTYRLRNFLKERLHQPLTVDEVAHALHTSPRTLARWLANEGTTFQRTKDKLRRDLAIELLNKTSQSVASIGSSLGFEDPAAFNRAFRQWTGSAPGAYRKSPIVR